METRYLQVRRACKKFDGLTLATNQFTRCRLLVSIMRCSGVAINNLMRILPSDADSPVITSTIFESKF